MVNEIRVEHPQPLVTIPPNLRCLPLLVRGIPVFLDIFCFTLVTPVRRFQEKPPLLGIISSYHCILVIDDKFYYNI